MLFPYSSDAPLYHWPYATVGLILVNLALFFLWPPYDIDKAALNQHVQNHSVDQSVLEQREDDLPEEQKTITDPEEEAWLDLVVADLPDELKYPDWRMLQFGNGLHPVQWVTANFMHADLLHVCGNMLFLWAMGIVIEGKVGWWKFLLMYVGIGTLGYAIVQGMMLGATAGNALGASLPIFGLIMLAMLWAPLNDFCCVLFLLVTWRLVEVPIYLFALIYFIMQLLPMFFGGFGMSSEMLHMIGALVGAPVGILMLQYKLVDCEHYDAFSVWRGEHELSRDERREKEESTPAYQAKVSSQRETMLAQIQAIVEQQKNPVLAWTAHERMSSRFADWSLPKPLFYSIVRLYHQQGKGGESVPAMFAFVRAFSVAETVDVRLKLAEVLIRGDRPRQGLSLLTKLDPTALSEPQRTAISKLESFGQRRRKEVELEPAVEEL